MTTFAEILNETNKMLQMSAQFSARYIEQVQVTQQATQNAPCVIIPATETKQGEQKAPVAKPNGVTR